MNASTVILMFVIGLFAVVSGFPAADSFKQDGLYIRVKEEVEDSESLLPEQLDDQEESGLRFRRATCDLLSISLPFGSLNHSACAAHCLAMRKGYRGGRCKDGVCHCRR